MYFMTDPLIIAFGDVCLLLPGYRMHFLSFLWTSPCGREMFGLFTRNKRTRHNNLNTLVLRYALRYTKTADLIIRNYLILQEHYWSMRNS